MAKAKDFIDFIKKNKLEDVEFATGYDDSYGLSFDIQLENEDHQVMYQFAQNKKGETYIKEVFFVEEDLFDREITTEEALKLRGLL